MSNEKQDQATSPNGGNSSTSASGANENTRQPLPPPDPNLESVAIKSGSTDRGEPLKKG